MTTKTHDSNRHGEGPWCDDCHGYTHMPWCSRYVEDELSVPHTERQPEGQQTQAGAISGCCERCDYMDTQEKAQLAHPLPDPALCVEDNGGQRQACVEAICEKSVALVNAEILRHGTHLPNPDFDECWTLAPEIDHESDGAGMRGVFLSHWRTRWKDAGDGVADARFARDAGVDEREVGAMNITVLAQFEYKCRRCGQVTDGSATAKKNGSTFLVNIVMDIKPEPMLSMVGVHSCDSGGEGVTDLIGYRLEAKSL